MHKGLSHFSNSLLGHSQYILWATDPDRGFCAISYWSHFEDFGCFWTENLLNWEKNLLSSQHVGGKKIKLKYQFFFLIGEKFISSEDSSPIEYTESGLSLGASAQLSILVHESDPPLPIDFGLLTFI